MGHNDDFLYPSDIDYDTACDKNSDIISNNIVLPLGGTLSIICYIYLLWMYFVVKSPVLMRHPTTLAIYKCILDIIFVQQYLWLPFVASKKFYTDDLAFAPFYCISSKLSAVLSFLTQFSLLGSELCFLVISVDLRIAYTNPFSSFKETRWHFATFVIGVALSTAFALIGMGDKVYGLASEGVVWIQDRRANDSPDYTKLILFYLIVGIIYVYCLWANFQYYRSSEKGFSQTLSNRLSIMQRSKRFTLAYITYDTITLSLEFISYLGNGSSKLIDSLPAYFYCCRGICALIIILYSNAAELTWHNLNPFQVVSSDQVDNVALEGLLFQPHLNASLRVEILYFATHGIMQAAKEFHKRVESESVSQVDAQSNIAYDNDDHFYSFDEHSSTSSLRPSDHKNSGLLKSLQPSLDMKPIVVENGTGVEMHQTTVDSQRSSMIVMEKLHERQSRAVSEAVESVLRSSVYRYSQTIDGSSRTSSQKWASAVAQNPVHSNWPLSDSMSGVGSDRNTESTIKWRDTMDVEFGVMESDTGLSVTSSAHANEDVPSWQRISSRANNISVARVHSSTSQNSAVDSFRKALNTAILNASSAAKTVFSPAYREFRFKDYCPKLFARVRAMVDIKVEDYAKSFETTCREKFSEGRSGAFMFYSSDQKCIVKTITKEDLLTLREIMPAYVQYLEENPTSLIVRFLGAHCITMYGVELHFVVMLNMFPTSNLSERYDLKGSWVNRHGFSGTPRSALDRTGLGRENIPPLFQDNDLQQKISLTREVAEALTKQIFRDIDFLKAQGRMDYSLLIGVKRERFRVLQNGSAVPVDSRSEPAAQILSMAALETLVKHKDESGGYRALIVDGPGCYYIGIIDVLQGWTWKKRIERFLKIYFQLKDGDGISALPPSPYADRFLKRCVLDTFEGMNDMKFRVDSSVPTLTSGISSFALGSTTIPSNRGTVGVEESQVSRF